MRSHGLINRPMESGSCKSNFLPWLIWVLSALFVVFNYIQQVVPNIIAVDLSHTFKATESTLGNIAASYFYAYAILQIPVGLIVDRFGTHRPLVLAILTAGFGTLDFSPVKNRKCLELGRLSHPVKVPDLVFFVLLYHGP